MKYICRRDDAGINWKITRTPPKTRDKPRKLWDQSENSSLDGERVPLDFEDRNALTHAQRSRSSSGSAQVPERRENLPLLLLLPVRVYIYVFIPYICMYIECMYSI